MRKFTTALLYRYYNWKLERWLNARGIEQQMFTDSNGIVWNLTQLSTYIETQYITNISLSEIWMTHCHLSVWGTGLPNLEQAYQDIVAKSYLELSISSLLELADLTGDWKDHLSRITLFTCSLKMHRIVPPLLIGPDDTIWDGYHRLVAYKLCQIRTVEAIKFRPPKLLT